MSVVAGAFGFSAEGDLDGSYDTVASAFPSGAYLFLSSAAGTGA